MHRAGLRSVGSEAGGFNNINYQESASSSAEAAPGISDGGSRADDAKPNPLAANFGSLMPEPCTQMGSGEGMYGKVDRY